MDPAELETATIVVDDAAKFHFHQTPLYSAAEFNHEKKCEYTYTCGRDITPGLSQSAAIARYDRSRA
jgi:hypothetical protein